MEPAPASRGPEREEGEVTPSKEVDGATGPPAKHPLEHRWTLWFDNPQTRGKGGGWGSSLRPIYTFATVEDFWCLYNNIAPAGRLPSRADMHLFKEGIEPKWEDPRCERGGSWTVPCHTNKGHLEKVWLHTLLALIGEQLDEGEDVCGAVISIRPQKDRVAVWTKSADKESVQLSIGKQLKELLDVSEKISFAAFKDQKSRGAPDKYTV